MSRRQLFPVLIAALMLLCFQEAASHAQSKSPLSSGSARNLIRRMADIELPSGAVRVKSLSSPDRTTVDVVAQIETAFRFVKEREGWRVAEVRTGDNRWEETELILRALNVEETKGVCVEVNSLTAAREDVDPSVRQARCLIAELIGIGLPSDAVRVRSVAPLALGNAPSAVVEARVEVEFRLVKGTDGKWRVSQMRTGGNRRIDVEPLENALNAEKRARALEEIETLATALEAFRRERGFYIEAKTESALVDSLNPRYLRRVIRIDPWRKPYHYEGTRHSYTLRSDGADGKRDTSDDIVKRNDERVTTN
ncbi:MAG: type II secretion system protein GspG [Pyrinomonadaceae bacterium]|nr:type II secretion system protein GspG [Pyrinomonadaceae bacterium]